MRLFSSEDSMKGALNALSVRNAAIIHQRQLGKDTSTIAAEFGVTRARVCQIVRRFLVQQQQRAALVKIYGTTPNIAWLSDSTPIEVLALCDGKIQGWARRLRHLEYAHGGPVRTLGDLRRLSDEELKSVECIGTRMARELRRFCPFQSVSVT
jgi:hypothetical protein